MKAVRFLTPIIVAVILGPLVAGLSICILATINSALDPTLGLSRDLLAMFGVYIIVAYLEGSAIALLAGLLVSLWMLRHPPGMLVAIVAAMAAVGIYRLAAEIGVPLPANADVVRLNLALTLVLAVIAAGVCWLVTRRFASADMMNAPRPTTS